MQSVTIVLLCLIFIACNTPQKLAAPPKNCIEAPSLNERDGPYIYTHEDKIEILNVIPKKGSGYKIERIITSNTPEKELKCIAENKDSDRFLFHLNREYRIPPNTYKAQDKLFVTSDIEGNFNAFFSMLIGSQVMDNQFNWTFGDGHLVICGDMFDRGNNVLPSLWLLYRLEQEAPKYGGQVHFILGNHDVMQLQLDIRYVHPKYLELAKIISKKEDDKEAYRYLMSSRNELIRWVQSKNAIEKIGGYIFLHGGISQEMADAKLSIDTINQIVRDHMHELLISNPGQDSMANLVFGRKGPLWYRGMVRDYKEYYKKMNEEELDKILSFYDADKIIVGHTIIDEKITSDFNGKLIRVDIKHSNEKFTGASEGLLIKGGKFYVVNDHGIKRMLDME